MSVKLKYIEEGTVVTCHAYTGENWSDEQKNILQSAKFDLAKIPAELHEQLAMYGLKKILQDRNSDLKGQEKIEGMVKTMATLEAGQFIAERESTGGGKPRRKKVDPFLAQAVAAVTGNDVLAVTAKLETMEKEAIKALAEHDKVVAKMKELREQAESAAINLEL